MPEQREIGANNTDTTLPAALGYKGAGLDAIAKQNIVIPVAAAAAINWSETKEDELNREQSARQARIYVTIDSPEVEWEASFPFGFVKKPQQDTLKAHKQLLQTGGLEFSPQNYALFDGIIVNAGSASPAFTSRDARYPDYASLRRNIALLRNYLLARMFPKGQFHPKEKTAEGRQDANNYARIKQMAQKLGSALAASGSKLLEPANVPDKGAQAMYDYLFALQDKPKIWDALPFTQNPRDWGLAPNEKTPFSTENIMVFSAASSLQGIALEFDRIIRELRSVDDLTPETKKISVEYAEEILRRLQLLFGNNSNEASYMSINSDPREDEGSVFLRAARAFKDTLFDVVQLDANMLKDMMTQDETLQEAMQALDQINYRMKSEAAKALEKEGRKEAAAWMNDQIRKMPESAKTNAPMSTLTQKLEKGMATAVRLRQIALAAKAAQITNANTQMRNATRNAARQAGVSDAILKANVGNIRKAVNNGSISNARITQATQQVAEKIRLTQEQIALDEEARRHKLPPNPNNNVLRR